MSSAVNSIKGLANNVLGNSMMGGKAAPLIAPLAPLAPQFVTPLPKAGDAIKNRLNQIVFDPFEMHLVDKITSSVTKGQYGGEKGVGSLMGNKAAPPIAPPVVMPLPNDQAVEAAKKKQMAMMLAAGGGRASTILSQPSDRLGG